MEINEPVKKPGGCLKATGYLGLLMVIASLLFIAGNIAMIIYSERHMDELREEYKASTQEYEEALAAYNADSAHLNAEFNRITAEIEAAEAKGDTILASQLQDSLMYYSEPVWERRGAIGVNIGAAFFVAFAVFALIPLALGLIMYLFYRYRKRQYQRSTIW